MKKALCVVLYLVILVLIVYAVSNAFIVRSESLPYNNTTKVEGFYAEPRDTLDVVFVGASTTFMGVNPSILWREYGVPSYSFATAGQRVQLSQLYVKEAIDRQHPDVIMVDIGGMRHDEDFAPAARNYTALNWVPLSLNKIDAIFRYTPREEWLSHLLPLIKYHSSGEVDFTNWEGTKTDPYMGYSPFFGNYDKTFKVTITDSVQETEKLNTNAEQALRDIIAACKASNVKLVLYRTPSSMNNAALKRFQEVKRIAAEEKVPVLDLCTEEWVAANEYEIKYDHSNSSGHPNWRGATKITRAIGDYLMENNMVVDRRDDPAYALWNEKTEPYYRLENLYLSQEALKVPTDLSSYLQALCDIPKDGVVILATVYNDGSRKVTKADDALLAQLGANKTLRGKFRYAYLLVNVDGKKTYFQMDENKALFFEKNLGGVKVKASSASNSAIVNKSKDYPDVAINEVVIGGKTYTTQRGLNIFVYNYVEKEIVSVASFDTYTTAERRPVESAE